MFSQFFGNYLLENQKITAEQFASCMDYIKENRVKLGLIAEKEGLLSREQAEELNELQTQSDKRFGDLAIENGYLTEYDVSYLLSRQGNLYLIFVQALEENNILTRDEVDQEIPAFQSSYGFSDEQLKAVEDGDIEKVLPAFIGDEDSKYIPLVGLALRNLIRFVSSYIRIDKGTTVSSLSSRYMAYQRTTGDYDGFLGFASDDDESLLSIAEAFAKETFDAMDEDALDSVSEFTNCINGLYATEQSYQNISIDMLPPEFLFDGTIEDQDNFIVIPVFIEGQKVNLFVKAE